MQLSFLAYMCNMAAGQNLYSFYIHSYVLDM